MRFTILLAAFLIVSTAFAQLSYPVTKKVEVTDNYFGTTIADPYRWLEDDNSEETKSWVQQQNNVTSAYFSAIPYREKVKDRLAVLWNYPKYGSPRKEGGYYYFSKMMDYKIKVYSTVRLD